MPHQPPFTLKQGKGQLDCGAPNMSSAAAWIVDPWELDETELIQSNTTSPI